MKVLVCEKCGAKYQIDDNEDIDDYECSVCAGSLQSVQNYPSTNLQSNKNHDNNTYQTEDANSQMVRCKNCGLKYTIGINETPEDYECSSCFGDLRYIDEELNKQFEDDLKTRKSPQTIQSNNPENNIKQNKTNLQTNTSQKQSIESDQSPETNVKSTHDSNIISPLTETNINKIEKKLRRKIKEDFSSSIAESYGDPVHTTKEETIEDKVREKLKEENYKESIFDRISKRNKEGINRDNLPENIAIDREIAELNNASESEIKKIDETLKKSNKKQELIPHPNIKNNSYHDVYIVAGLIVALIGVSDVLLSQRVYGIIFIGIGIVLFVIGVIKNKSYTATEKRGKIIREKLLTLPERFYVLYFVKVPNAQDGINHVVVGASGIFSIVSQSYNEKEDKEKSKIETENINLVAKSKLNDLTFEDPENEDTTNNNQNNTNNKNYKNNPNNSKNIDYQNKMNSKDKIQQKINDSKNPTNFKFIECQKRFDHNNKIKQKSIHLSEALIDFLNENGLKDCYVEPLVGFVNNDVAVINMPLTDEDLFLDELLRKITHGKKQLDEATTHKVAVLLSQYSTECSS